MALLKIFSEFFIICARVSSPHLSAMVFIASEKSSGVLWVNECASEPRISIQPLAMYFNSLRLLKKGAFDT